MVHGIVGVVILCYVSELELGELDFVYGVSFFESLCYISCLCVIVSLPFFLDLNVYLIGMLNLFNDADRKKNIWSLKTH